MTTRADIVACARTYLGTPFHHQGRLRGVGIDCVGVPIKVAHELGLTTFDVSGYSRQPNPAVFRRLCVDNLDPIGAEADVRPGDLVSIAFEVEQHLGIITRTDPLTVLHCYSKVGKVVEHPLDGYWARKVRGWWRFRGVTEQ